MAEKEKIDREMVESGFVFDEKNPDIYIVNTCGVTQKAEREARQLIYQLKKKQPKAKIVITGCGATYWKKNKVNIGTDLPVDLLIDNKNKKKLVSLLFKNYGRAPNNVTRCLEYNDNKFSGSKRSLIKIQDGCNRFCSYCIVPYLRGLPQSKTISDIIKEIKLFKTDISEVILTAINTEAYGKDTGESLVDLITKVFHQTKIKRLSFGSIHPWSINEKFIKYYPEISESNRFVHFFHIPLQSGSNKILKLMKRDYTREEIKLKLKKIQKINPMALIATDIIVGFLDETDHDFQETYEFLEKSPIFKFHVFRFSKRAETAAYYMAKRLKEPTDIQKKQRAKALID
jgi:threonylcarbamoyladenosine tRNA methylthiotransferase MtaB